MSGQFAIEYKNELEYIRPELLLFGLNRHLEKNYGTIEHFSDGVAYLQLLHRLFPDLINLNDIIMDGHKRTDRLSNWILISTIFKKLQCCNFFVRIDKIVDFKYMQCYNFCCWFFKFYNMSLAHRNKVPTIINVSGICGEPSIIDDHDDEAITITSESDAETDSEADSKSDEDGVKNTGAEITGEPPKKLAKM